ncbi:MAG: biopolymer transporter ExbD [Deltaproteobacteria bacterium]|nr:biopolymer transporter ExbD [Deltaproteobacteria bacterium]
MITEINVTPLVDIMLVLLIIFMLTANLIAKQAIDVDLPKASQGSAPKKSPIGITLTREGGLYLNGEEVTPAQLRAAVAAAVKDDAKATVLIAGDKHTSHGRVVWVLDVVKSLGVTNFAIQIDPASLQPPMPRTGAP